MQKIDIITYKLILIKTTNFAISNKIKWNELSVRKFWANYLKTEVLVRQGDVQGRGV